MKSLVIPELNKQQNFKLVWQLCLFACQTKLQHTALKIKDKLSDNSCPSPFDQLIYHLVKKSILIKIDIGNATAMYQCRLF